MQRYGANSIGQIMLTQNWYLDHMPRLKAAFEDGTLASIPKDRDILDDLRAITVIKGIPRLPEGKTKTGQGQQRHGDAAVALCLAWFAATQGGGLIEYLEVPLRSEQADQPRGGNFMRPPPDTDYQADMGRRAW